MGKDNNCIGLALSGGGYRAAAYHLGTLRALYKLGVLDKIDTISSVSGGSIVSAYYLLHVGDFKNFDEKFYKKLGCGVMHLAFLNVLLVLGIFAALGFFVNPWLSLLIIPSFWFFCYKMFPLSWLVELQYRWLFFGNKTLSDLPDKPSLVINTTDVAQGCLFKFSKNRAWGYNYQNRMMHDDDFTGINFPISTAVMASTCVPFAFTPLRMPAKYRKKKSATCPLLVDGGLYDNQGVHELGENGDHSAKYIIVSNAGNSELDDKRIWNVVKMLVKTSNILMKRIEKMQSRKNMFLSENIERRYAYCNLNYDNTDRLVKSFVRNIAFGLVPIDVCILHGISEDSVIAFRNRFKQANMIDGSIMTEFIALVKQSIGWDELQKTCPTEKEAACAKNVGTNLIGLSKKKRDALTKYAEWMTTVQVRLYLPNILP